MHAAVYTGDRTIEVREVPDAGGPGAGEVVVAVGFVGICGTDLHILHGAMDERVSVPATLGHEMSGRVAAVGEGVSGWSVGDAVTVMPLDWDGTCPACLAGHRHLCHGLNFVGIDSPGALQGMWRVKAQWLVGLPDGVSLEHAALAEPVAVAVHDVRRSGLAAGERAVVLGGGPIGLLIAVVARDLGALVLVSEPDPGRRATLQAAGLDTIDPLGEDLEARVEEWTGGAGADVVFEVSGAVRAVAAATGLAKRRGRVVIVAIHPTPPPVDLKAVFWKELSIIGTRVYVREDFEEALRLLAAGTIPTGVVISQVLPLDRTPEAFTTLEAGQAMKILIDCQTSQTSSTESGSVPA